jgi:hypothetical protein
MRILRVVVVVLALLLLAAHFFRRGALPVALGCAAAPFLLRVESAWGRRVLQLVLVLGSVEWLRTLWIFTRARQTAGEPWFRLVLILGAVAAVTLVAAVWAGRRFRPTA